MPSLSECDPDTEVRIVTLGGDPVMTNRLMEMGLLPGTPARVVRRAPLGDPIDIEVRGYHLSLRRADAEQIEIERL